MCCTEIARPKNNTDTTNKCTLLKQANITKVWRGVRKLTPHPCARQKKRDERRVRHVINSRLKMSVTHTGVPLFSMYVEHVPRAVACDTISFNRLSPDNLLLFYFFFLFLKAATIAKQTLLFQNQ